MSDAAIAQRLLEFVMSRERAAAIAGDLMEDAARGRDWFWPTMRIAACHVGRALWDSPLQLTKFAAWGLAESLLACLVWLPLAGLGLIPVWMRIAPYYPTPNSMYIPPWGFNLLMVWPLYTVFPFLAGWRAGKRGWDRAVPAGLCLAVVFLLLGIRAALFHGVAVPVTTDPYPRIEYPLLEFGSAAVCCMAGAIRHRAQALRRTNCA